MHADSPAGRWVAVEVGDTLESIAARAGVPAEDIAEVNGLRGPEDIVPGRMIFVLERAAPPAEGPPPAALVAGMPALRWPLDIGKLVVSSHFGVRDGRPHEGIDLAAPNGTPVFAAADGTVAYAGNGIRGYGNIVVLRHGNGLMTVYAHNSVVLASRGQSVRAGDRIALVGQSGRATGPHLHFEVRVGEIPRNPLAMLPEVPR
jgi:murein DD-endopeptidase MepM/ murein hydrolase activator NlpD